MLQLNELAKDIPEMTQERKQRTKSKFTTMSFVKGSSEGSSSQSPSMGFVSPPKVETQSKIGFVKSGIAFQSTDIQSSTYQDINQAVAAPPGKVRAHFEIEGAAPKKKSKKKNEVVTLESCDSDQTFALLRHHLKQLDFNDNPISILSMALQKTKIIVQSDFKDVTKDKGVQMFECTVSLDGIVVSSATKRNKKLAKKVAFEGALKALKQPHHKIVMTDNGSKELQTSENSFVDLNTGDLHTGDEDHTQLPNGELAYETNAPNIGIPNFERKKHGPVGNKTKDLDELIFLDSASTIMGAAGLLRQSSDFSKMLIEYDYSRCSEGVSCRITLEGQPLVECTGENKAVAKTQASENAVDLLKKMCWTIKVADSDSTSLGKDEIIGDVEKLMCAIPDCNVGNKLLRKMGWEGGGVGKDGTGRAELVTLVVNREGLGLDSKKGISVDNKDRLRKCVDNYASSDNCDDLVFAPGFTKEERALIHQHSQRLGLKTHSHGAGDERYLVISRKRSHAQLFHHILSKGGSTSIYELIPPQR